jgi:hypothetical protein
LVFPAPDDADSLGTPSMKVHKRGYTAGWADKRERRTKKGKRKLVMLSATRKRGNLAQKPAAQNRA